MQKKWNLFRLALIVTLCAVCVGIGTTLYQSKREETRNTAQRKAEQEARQIVISLSPKAKTFAIGGPARFDLTIKNNSKGELFYGVIGPDFIPVQFSVFGKSNTIKKRQLEEWLPGLFLLPPIGAGKTHIYPFHLNRYFQFLKPGKSRISYKVTMGFLKPDKNGGPSHDSAFDKVEVGTIEIDAKAVSRTVLEQQLADVIKKWNNPYEDSETLQALRFFDSSLLIKHLDKLPKNRAGSDFVVQALESRNGPEVDRLLIVAITNGAEEVQSVLPRLAKRKILLREKQIDAILKNRDPLDSQAFAVREYLSKFPKRKHSSQKSKAVKKNPNIDSKLRTPP